MKDFPLSAKVIPCFGMSEELDPTSVAEIVGGKSMAGQLQIMGDWPIPAL
jgi:hypothetical protein